MEVGLTIVRFLVLELRGNDMLKNIKKEVITATIRGLNPGEFFLYEDVPYIKTNEWKYEQGERKYLCQEVNSIVACYFYDSTPIELAHVSGSIRPMMRSVRVTKKGDVEQLPQAEYEAIIK